MESSFSPLLGGAVGGVIGLFLVAVIGLIIGVLAKLLVPGRDPGGWFATVVLGIVGSWIGHFFIVAGGLAGSGAVLQFAAAVLGAVLVLLVVRLARVRA